MALSDAEVARWVATASKLPPGPWHVGWMFDEGLFCSWYNAPPPMAPVSDGWPQEVDEEALAASGITAVDQDAAMSLAAMATMAIPTLVAEVQRLRAALADLAAEEGAVPPPPADGNLVYAEGYADGADMMAVRAQTALEGEGHDD